MFKRLFRTAFLVSALLSEIALNLLTFTLFSRRAPP